MPRAFVASDLPPRVHSGEKWWRAHVGRDETQVTAAPERLQVIPTSIYCSDRKVWSRGVCCTRKLLSVLDLVNGAPAPVCQYLRTWKCADWCDLACRLFLDTIFRSGSSGRDCVHNLLPEADTGFVGFVGFRAKATTQSRVLGRKEHTGSTSVHYLWTLS